MATLSPPANLVLESPLWHFALRLWKDAEIRDFALSYQRQGGVVSHLLVALWLTEQGQVWDGVEPSEIATWREQSTQRLRDLRQALKKNPYHRPCMNCGRPSPQPSYSQSRLNWPGGFII